MLPFGGSTVPEGFLLCNGAAISRTTYAKLFAAIGTLYGAGDGATTFNLPDMRDRFAEGAGTYSVGTAVEAGLPNITGILYLVTGSNDCTGSFYFTSSTNSRISASVVANANNVIGFSASKSTSIYGNSTTVQPSSLVLNYVIKY